MNLLPKTTYRALPALPATRRRYVGPWHTRLLPPFEFLRLLPTRWRQAATLLIDWDRAADDGWPRLRSPAHAAIKRFRRVNAGGCALFGRFAARAG